MLAGYQGLQIAGVLCRVRLCRLIHLQGESMPEYLFPFPYTGFSYTLAFFSSLFLHSLSGVVCSLPYTGVYACVLSLTGASPFGVGFLLMGIDVNGCLQVVGNGVDCFSLCRVKE